MMADLFQRILRKIRSDIILNKIESGKIVYFENPLEQIAFKYTPGGMGRIGKYYAKHYNQDEYEIDPDSTSILMAVMEGRPIGKTRYDKYHLIKSVYWSRAIKNPCEGQRYKRYLANG